VIRLEPNWPPPKKGGAWPLAVRRLRSDWRQVTDQQRYGALRTVQPVAKMHIMSLIRLRLSGLSLLSLFGQVHNCPL